MALEEGDIVLCTVDRIVGTVVFVRIDSENNQEGSIVTSEIAPGRIRNLREYVVPKKKIICKVLRIKGKGIELSLRRVSQKEKKELLEQNKQEKKFSSLLKMLLKEKADETINKITENESLFDFIEKAKEDPKELDKYLEKKISEKIKEVLAEEKNKESLVRKEISLKTNKSNGLELIKEILGNLKEIEVRYLSAGRYSLSINSSDLKQADNQINQKIQDIEKIARKKGMEFSIIQPKK